MVAGKCSSRVGVLIFSHTPVMTEIEKVSFHQCCSVLHGYPIILVCPRSLDVSQYTRFYSHLRLLRVPDEAMASLRAYNRMKVSSWFYELVKDFEYILTHELDAFVFSDQLAEWCDEGFDYVGAPWFEGYEKAESIDRVLPGGNSGFSLRKVASCRRVLRTFRFLRPLPDVFRAWRCGNSFNAKGICTLIKMMFMTNVFHSTLNGFGENEDLFWSKCVPERLPWFRVAPFAVALRFSFEVMPRQLFERNGKALPFGCHKWNTYDPEFWGAHIEKLGYRI